MQRVIADAVRLGYDVIGQNLQQGRAAADRFSAGAYGVKHAKDDVGALGGRLVQLARDLSTVSFDLAAAVLRDPILHEALKPKPPTPGDKPGDDSPGGAPVNVGCQVRGNDKASAAPFVLSQPERPSRLSAAGLYSPDRSLPPITNLTFLASDDGASIIAVITVPADQPAGTYSGVVCDEETHAPLGTLSVKVAP